jgi:hypothetical protein
MEMMFAFFLTDKLEVAKLLQWELMPNLLFQKKLKESFQDL